jgi:hypothetical protein
VANDPAVFPVAQSDCGLGICPKGDLLQRRRVGPAHSVERISKLRVFWGAVGIDDSQNAAVFGGDALASKALMSSEAR